MCSLLAFVYRTGLIPVRFPIQLGLPAAGRKGEVTNPVPISGAAFVRYVCNTPEFHSCQIFCLSSRNVCVLREVIYRSRSTREVSYATCKKTRISTKSSISRLMFFFSYFFFKIMYFKKKSFFFFPPHVLIVSSPYFSSSLPFVTQTNHCVT